MRSLLVQVVTAPRQVRALPRVWFRTCLTALLVLGSCLPALAHGDMAGPDELGPPLAISGALAFISYWLMVLWPRKPQPGPEAHDGPGDDDDDFDQSSGTGGASRRGKNGPIKVELVKVKIED